MKNLLKITVLAALIPATALLADDKPKGKGNPFKKHDTDNDGKISKAEFLAPAKNKEAAEGRFAKADADKDGFLSAEEFKATMGKPKKKEGAAE
jgi:Ca2+-binding EF-hand superfamily protein